VILFSFSALTLLVGRQKGSLPIKKAGCWFVGGDNLAGALHVLPLTPPSFAAIKSRIEKFLFTVRDCIRRTAYAVCRADEQRERENAMQEEHQERRIQTVLALKRDLEVNEVWAVIARDLYISQ